VVAFVQVFSADHRRQWRGP